MDLESGTYVPQEILNLIIEQLHDDFRTILNLCLVSQSVCSSARRILYRRIRVVTSVVYRLTQHDPQTLNIHGCTRFLTAVAINNPHLAQYVREFHYAPENSPRPAEFWKLMNRAFYHMVNLKVLSFRNFVSPSKRNLFWGTKFQLEEFYWEDGYPTDIDGETIWFLKSQSQLRVLSAQLSAPPGRADNFIPLFPKLQTFIGDVDSIKQLVRSNAVEKLRWKGSSSDQLVGLHQAAVASFVKLRVLSIGVAWIPQRLVAHLRSLEVLHITGFHDSDRLNDLIHRLSSLRVFICSPQTGPDKFLGEDEQRNIAKGFFSNAKHLEMIYFSWIDGPTAATYAEENNFIFWSWARGEIAPVLMTWLELAERESLHEFAPLLDTSRVDQFPMY